MGTIGSPCRIRWWSTGLVHKRGITGLYESRFFSTEIKKAGNTGCDTTHQAEGHFTVFATGPVQLPVVTGAGVIVVI